MSNLVIVDPKGTHAEFLKAFLRGRGHRVAIAADADAVRATLGTALFDGLILTGSVADLDGLEVANLGLLAWLDDSIEFVRPDGAHASHPRSLEKLDVLARSLAPRPADGPSVNVIRASMSPRRVASTSKA